jgi:uncharacterized phage protein gp47/JayE
MSYRIPTTQELFNIFLTKLETALGQTSPLNDKAFLRQLSGAESGLGIGLYKYGADGLLQTLALTATGDGLDRIGLDNSTPRTQAVNAILTVTLPAVTGTIIPASTDFFSDANGLRYRPEVDVTAVANVATLSLRCVESGVAGNLDISDTFSIGSQIAGADTVATVTVISTLGVDKETDADYRPRVIFAQRAITGGGNATDHKIWSEAVTGVKRAFPYSGRPVGISFPGDRTVYIECDISIDADGIPPLPLLADVRAAINTDPDTGLSRTLLGLTDATLWVEPIIRTSIFVEIRQLVVAPAQLAALQTAISDALTVYFRTIAPYVDGVDVEQERTDTITSTSISQIVQDVLYAYGATVEAIAFGLVLGVFMPLYFLNPGELAKLGGVTYI